MTTTEREQASLDRVTDHVEEKEIDSNKVQQAMSVLAASGEQSNAQATVQIQKEDVELLQRELDVTKQKAESLLRTAGGSAQEALLAYLRS